MEANAKPRLGISACLLGHAVRYDGGHKRNSFLTGVFGRHVEWVPVCPELELGMGVPREPVRLVAAAAALRMVGERSGKDWTAEMTRFAARRTKALAGLNLAGYVFKRDSPSCGVDQVLVYTEKGTIQEGRGLFAAVVTARLPLLPVEEEGRLDDPSLRENFIDRVFAYHRWQRLLDEGRSMHALTAFHMRHKLLLLAHNETLYRRLGRLVAGVKPERTAAVYDQYGLLFMKALSTFATPKRHANVLEHMMGYFSRHLSDSERAELSDAIAAFRRERVPLIVPLTLIRGYVRKYRIDYLRDQVYLEPSPGELMLGNPV